MPKTKQNKAYIYALLAVLCWSTIGSAFKISLRYVSYEQLLFYACLTAVIFLASIVLFSKKRTLLMELKIADYGRSAVLGLLNPFLYYLILIKAYDLLLAQEAVVLNYAWPVSLVILSIPLLKQRLSIKSLLAILISFSGVVIIALRGDFTSIHFSRPMGVALALFSTIVWALYWIFNIKDKKDEVVRLFLNSVFGFIYISIYSIIFTDLRVVSWEGYAGMAYSGLVEMGIAFILWLKALRLSDTTAKVSNLIFISPFLSLIFVNSIVGEAILPSSLIGLLLIVGGIAVQRIEKISKREA